MLKILLIKRGALGDILMTTPLIRQIKHHHPQAVIDYCLSPTFAYILQDNPYLHEVIAVNDNTFTVRGIWQYIKLIYGLRKKYDYIFILGKSWPLNVIHVLFKGITIGYARESISKYLLNQYVVYNDINRYHVLYNLDLLNVSQLARADYTNTNLDLPILQTSQPTIDAILEQVHFNNFIIVINSGGNNQYESGGVRMLPYPQIYALLQALLTKSANIILLGGRNDIANYDIYCRINPTRIFNYANKWSLVQSIYVMSKAQHVYTTDCGAMHLGVIANLGHRMTCFFGPTCPWHVLPSHNAFRIIWLDKDIFNPDYPLKGKYHAPKLNIAGAKCPEFFTRIDMNQFK